MGRKGRGMSILDDMMVDIVRTMVGTESTKIVVGDRDLEAMREDVLGLTRGTMTAITRIHVAITTVTTGETIVEEQTIIGKEIVLSVVAPQVPTHLRIDV